MGTNFYAVGNATCDNPDHWERLHIGKSSSGWKFLFRAHPELGLTSWWAWRSYLTEQTNVSWIEDEYGSTVSLDELTARVEGGTGNDRDHHDHGSFYDPQGYDFADWEFR